MCFVWIWEQTAIISLYSINWLVCITETECVYCAVRTGSLYIIQVMCFVWIWEQTAIISLYSINWLVFVTETECVYCAVRTGSLYVSNGKLTYKILRSAHTVYLCVFVWISEQTAIISLYSINWLVFITETECVYYAVRTGHINAIQDDNFRYRIKYKFVRTSWQVCERIRSTRLQNTQMLITMMIIIIMMTIMTCW